MSTLTVTNINTGSNSTTLTIATGGTYGGSIKLEAANSNMIISGNVNMANAAVNGVQVSGFMGGYKNKIINGNFDIWQRGTSNGMSGYFTADRWRSDNVGTTKTASRQSFTLGQTDVPGEPTYFMRHVVTSSAGASNYSTLGQYLESVRTLAGKTATLSFWAKADSSKNIAVSYDQYFGSGGSPSSTVTGIGATTIALTSSWQKFTVTAAIPSISGKTLGSNGNDYLGFYFWFDSGSTWNSQNNSLGQQSGTFDIAQVQLEEGPVATAFEQRHIGQELAMCQRYFEKSYNFGVNPGTGVFEGAAYARVYATENYGQGKVYFATTKRAIPVVALYSIVTGTVGKIRVYAAAVDVNGYSDVIGQTGFLGIVNNTSVTAIDAVSFHWTADAEI